MCYMKLEMTTSVRNIEAANCILRIGIEALQQNETLQHSNGIENIHIYEGMQFRKSLIKALVKSGKKVKTK